MNDIQFKELIELHINNELNKTFENEPCYEHFKDSYVIQENKYNLPLNNSLQVFNIEDIDYENGYVSIINVNNLQFPLVDKIYVNYNLEIKIDNVENNKIYFRDNDDLYLVAKGDIITDNVDKQENKIYIIVDVDNVRVETETISNTHNNTYYDVNIFVGSNDYSITKEEFNFFYNEIIKIFSEQSFNIDYNNNNLDVFTVNKPRYRSNVKTENDRIGYIILRFSHFYSNKIRI